MIFINLQLFLIPHGLTVHLHHYTVLMLGITEHKIIEFILHGLSGYMSGIIVHKHGVTERIMSNF